MFSSPPTPAITESSRPPRKSLQNPQIQPLTQHWHCHHHPTSPSATSTPISNNFRDSGTISLHHRPGQLCRCPITFPRMEFPRNIPPKPPEVPLAKLWAARDGSHPEPELQSRLSPGCPARPAASQGVRADSLRDGNFPAPGRSSQLSQLLQHGVCSTTSHHTSPGGPEKLSLVLGLGKDPGIWGG